jgi:hypothetical protein
MSCLLLTCYNIDDLKYLDIYISRVDSICVNNFNNDLDIKDNCLQYFIKNGIPGDIVNFKNLQNFYEYIKTCKLEYFRKYAYYLVENGCETILYNDDYKEDDFQIGENLKTNDSRKAIRYYKNVLKNYRYSVDQKYLSCLNLGRLNSDHNKKEKFFLLGISHDFTRAECFYELVVLYNEQKNYKKAVFYGSQLNIENLFEPRQVNLVKLQANEEIHKFSLDLNLGVSYFYNNMKTEGYYCTLRALKGSMNDTHRHLALENLKYYDEKSITKTIHEREFLIIDNFYQSNDFIKNIFLKDLTNDKYPNLEIVVNDTSELVLNPKICLNHAFDRFKHIMNYNISKFHPDSGNIICKGEYMTRWIDYFLFSEKDYTEYKWNAIIFIQPNPKGTHIEFLKNIKTGKKYYDDSDVSLIKADIYDNSQWIVSEGFEEVFNRCIIFPSNKFFRFGKYYNLRELDSYMMYQTFCYN